MRCVALLFLRLVGEPAKLLDWYESNLLNETVINLTPDKKTKMSVGEFSEMLLSNPKYIEVMVLPRLPQLALTTLSAEAVALAGHRRRHRENAARLGTFTQGAPVAALIDGVWQECSLLTLEEQPGGGAVSHCEVQTGKGEVVTVPLGLCIVLRKKIRRTQRRIERDARRQAAGLPALDYSRPRRSRETRAEEEDDEVATEALKRRQADAVQRWHPVKRKHAQQQQREPLRPRQPDRQRFEDLKRKYDAV